MTWIFVIIVTEPNAGYKHSEEVKKIMSIKALNRIKIKCIYCGMEMAIPQHNRWHGENCKNKILIK